MRSLALLICCLAPAVAQAASLPPGRLAPAAPEASERSGLKIDRLSRLEVKLRDAEVKVLEKLEPRNHTDLEGKSPTLGEAALNIAEVLAVRAGVMRPAKVYSQWVDEGRLMRGSEQNAAGFQALKAQGIKSVINLRREDNREAPIVEALGMKAIQLPFYDQALPSPREIQRFFDVMDAPENQPAYIHCEQGIGRTGLMVALYRIHHDGQSGDAAVAEAKAFGMNSKAQLAFISAFAAASARGAAWATISR